MPRRRQIAFLQVFLSVAQRDGNPCTFPIKKKTVVIILPADNLALPLTGVLLPLFPPHTGLFRLDYFMVHPSFVLGNDSIQKRISLLLESFEQPLKNFQTMSLVVFRGEEFLKFQIICHNLLDSYIALISNKDIRQFYSMSLWTQTRPWAALSRFRYTPSREFHIPRK